MSAFIQAMDSRTTTENGDPCISAAGVRDAQVALFFKLVRDLPSDSLASLFAAAVKEAVTPEAKADLVVLAFQTRGTRNIGKGERSLFYSMIKLLSEAFGAETIAATLPLVPHYGYYKDLLAILALGPPDAIKEACTRIYVQQLQADEKELGAARAEGRTPRLSLAAKYAPREGSSFDKKAGLAKAFAAAMHGGSNAPAAARKYRKAVSALNAALETTEVLMCAARWSEIKFASVASLCLQRCRKAFLNEALKGKLTPAEEATGNRFPEDEGRVAARAALRAALVAKKGVKGKALQPHEIAKKCMGRGLSTLEADMMNAQWADIRSGTLEAMAAAAELREKEVLAAAAPAAGLGSLAELKAALPKHCDLGKLVPLIDVSASMTGQPMEVAIALGILTSELTHPAFKHRCLTFESTPAWVDLSGCASILEKVQRVQSAGWGGSTDFEAACERILGAAEAAKLTADEVPDLIVFSDMQFNAANGGDYYGGYGGRAAPKSWETSYERLSRRFAEVGVRICGQPYAAPRVIFWNLRGNTVGFPVAKDAPNTQMLSGFSPALLKLVVSGADLAADEQEVVASDGTVKVVRSGPTPEQTLRAALDDANFDAVRLKLSELTEGPLAAYAFEKEDAGFALVEEEDASEAAAPAEAPAEKPAEPMAEDELVVVE